MIIVSISLSFSRVVPCNSPVECPLKSLRTHIFYFQTFFFLPKPYSPYLLLVKVSPVLQRHKAQRAVKESVCLASVTFFFLTPLPFRSNVFFITEMLPAKLRGDDGRTAAWTLAREGRGPWKCVKTMTSGKHFFFSIPETVFSLHAPRKPPHTHTHSHTDETITVMVILR